MVKKMAMVLLCTVLGTSLYADVSEAKGFLGLEVGAATVSADANNALYRNENHSGSDIEYGFRLGAQTDEWRTMFVFNYFDSDENNQNYEKGLLSVDYFLFSSDIGNDVSFKPFIGVNIGYMNYESDRTLYMFSIDESGLLYGAQGGFVFNATDTIDLDLMYRYSLTDAKHTDNIGSIVFGINYLY